MPFKAESSGSFVPDNPSNPQGGADTSILDRLASTGSDAVKAAVAPILAIGKPISHFVADEVNPPPETNEQANAAGHQGPTQNVIDYEKSSNYPPEGITTFAPSVDVAMAGGAAKDIAELGAKAIGKKMATKAALKSFIADAGTEIPEGVPTVPLTAPDVTELSHATSTKNANQIMDKGFDLTKAGTGADATQDVKGFMGNGVSMAKKPGIALANVQDGLAKKETSIIKSYLPQKDVLNVAKETHPELYDSLINPDPTVSKPAAESILTDAKQSGYKAVSFPDGETVVTDPKSIRLMENKPLVDTSKQLEFPLQTEGKGITFNPRQTSELEKAIGSPVQKIQPSFGQPTTGASTNISPVTPMVPKTEQAKAIERAANGEGLEPIPGAHVSTGKVEDMLPGATQRVKDFESIPSNQVDARNPLTSRAEMNKKVGQLEKTATDQWLAGVEAENKAVEGSLRDKVGLRKVSDIKPDSLESQALFHYIENPNKMEAFGKLASTAGIDTANKISKGEAYIRSKLDGILPQVNKVRAANSLAPIVYRGDYITHMNEFNILSTLGKMDILGTKEGTEIAQGINQADAKIAQMNPSLYTKLKEVVFPYVQRKNEEHATDAISAFDRYMDNAHRYIETQPYVNELTRSASAIQDKNPNLARYLTEQANYVSGGRSPLDKSIEMVIDKDLIKIATQLQNNAKGNVIMLNPSVPITQLFGLTSTAGKFPLRDSLMATMQSFADPKLQEYALANSPVLQSRALQVAENNLNVGGISRASGNLISWFDYKVAEISWMSAFKNAIRTQPLEEALNEANEWAAITQSHQGRVSTSPMMQSRAVQTMLPLMNQQVAAARSLLLNTFQGKSLAGKAGAVAKMVAYGAAVSALKSAVTGKEDNPLSPLNMIPFGGVLEHGVGGPVFNSAAKVATSKSGSELVRNLIRAGFLMQNKIPGGVIVGKQVEDALMGPEKKGKKHAR